MLTNEAGLHRWQNILNFFIFVFAQEGGIQHVCLPGVWQCGSIYGTRCRGKPDGQFGVGFACG